MLNFEKKTDALITGHSLIKSGDRLLVAVSGGPDSLALLDFLVRRRDIYEIDLAVAHVDHMLRGEASLQDLIFVKEYCEKNSLIFRKKSIDISGKMAIDQAGMQETARKYRYEFFAQVMKELSADTLVVGQHGDDQIETILMRLTRGSRGRSRAGIQLRRPFAHGEIIRPLLSVSKEEIEEYCMKFNLTPRRDPSNEQPFYTRNRFRLEVLPFLKKENKNVHEHFQRFSEDLTEDEDYLQELTRIEMNKICKFVGEEINIHIPAFHQVPLPLQRRGIHLILNCIYKQKIPDLTALHIRLIQQLLKSENPSGKLDMPLGLKVVRSYDSCRITFAELEQMPTYYHELNSGDQVVLPHGAIIQVKKSQGIPLKLMESMLVLNPQEFEFPLIIRTRRPGDQMRIKGMNGMKRVKNIFIDMKIPLHDRAIWPIVTDSTGKLLWIPELKKSCYHTTPATGHEYYIVYCSNQRPLGGQMNK